MVVTRHRAFVPSEQLSSFPSNSVTAGQFATVHPRIVTFLPTSQTDSGGIPTGSVAVFVNGNYVTSGTLVSTGQTTVTFAPTPGKSTVIATYEGDDVFAGSTSGEQSFSTVAPNTSNFSTSVRYGAPDYSGAVKVKIKVTVIGVPVEPAPTGSATVNSRFRCSAFSAVNGTQSVKITHHGNAAYGPGSTSAFVNNGGG